MYYSQRQENQKNACGFAGIHDEESMVTTMFVSVVNILGILLLLALYSNQVKEEDKQRNTYNQAPHPN
ncbi:hypothetical protein D1872_99550 [compost metagenome]